jgi:hypothetical protein
MKLRPAMLLCMGVLFATAPAWADKVPCCDFANGSTTGISEDLGHGFNAFGKDSFFSFSPSRKDLSSDLHGLGSYERSIDHTNFEDGWFGRRDKDRNLHGNDSRPASVPEPGTLSLLLLAVTTVGVFARKR